MKNKSSLSIGIVINGQTYIYNYGSTEKGKKSIPTENTLYEIGSISKTFTGTLLAQALVDKKINLEDDIRHYLNDSFPNLQYQGHPIKLIHLANHTSGLPRFLPDRPDIFKQPMDSIPFLLSDLQNEYTREQFFRDLQVVKLDTLPGFNYSYSNSGTQLAGFILEKVYQKTYGQLLAMYITDPLRMKHTRVVVPKNTTGLAKGYDSKGTQMPYVAPLSLGAGGIYSTIADMSRYLKFHLDEKNKVVYTSHQPTLGNISSNAIGLFWRINKTTDGLRRIQHTGGTFGFSSYCVLYPEAKMGIVLLTNEFDQTSQGALVGIADKLLEGFNAK